MCIRGIKIFELCSTYVPFGFEKNHLSGVLSTMEKMQVCSWKMYPYVKGFHDPKICACNGSWMEQS